MTARTTVARTIANQLHNSDISPVIDDIRWDSLTNISGVIPKR